MREMKLGRVAVFDPTSRQYPVRALFSGTEIPVSNIWYAPLALDQGSLSACVGFGWSHFLASFPDPVIGVTADHAIRIYKRAQRLDDFPGESYEGTATLAGAKAVIKVFPQLMSSFRWCFGLQDLILTVGHLSPVVLGVNWYSRMYETDSEGVIKVGGAQVGGHCLLCIGVDLLLQRFCLLNSWSREWGLQGQCYISFEDMDKLLSEQGEAVIGVGKHAGDLTPQPVVKI